MTFGSRKINETALSQKANASPILEPIFFDGRSGLRTFDGETSQRWYVDLDVKVSGISNDRSIFNEREMRFVHDILIPGRRYDEIRLRRCGGHCHDAKSIHHSFQRSHRLDFGDNDLRS